jgi:hypothetical protein
MNKAAAKRLSANVEALFTPSSSFAHAAQFRLCHVMTATDGDEHMSEWGESRGYRIGVAIAVVTSLLTVWTTVVRDDGNGIGFFMLILAAIVGGFAAWFRAAGMARTMLGVAVMQMLLGVAIATAPSTASVADGPLRALLFSAVFGALWLTSAAFFRAAAKDARCEVPASQQVRS